MSKDSIFPWLIACFLLLAVGACVGFDRSLEKFQREAIKKGHAVWITDESGHPTFKWKEARK